MIEETEINIEQEYIYNTIDYLNQDDLIEFSSTSAFIGFGTCGVALLISLGVAVLLRIFKSTN